MTNPDLTDLLPRPLHATVESAGYRVARWAAAREVLQTRVAKGRIGGALGEFLTRWLSAAPAIVLKDDLELTFVATAGQIRLIGDNVAFVASPLEQALLHLPALRSFWRSELRQGHFEALKAIVPSAWMRDEAPVPPGAVIHGLNIISWERLERANLCESEWRDHILTLPGTGPKINARYGRNDRTQIVLTSVEAMS
jgi:hypothetical protein